MHKGTVKFFNDAKGFGFITEEETQKEYFVHVSGLIDEIREGDVVEFELKEGKKRTERSRRKSCITFTRKYLGMKARSTQLNGLFLWICFGDNSLF